MNSIVPDCAGRAARRAVRIADGIGSTCHPRGRERLGTNGQLLPFFTLPGGLYWRSSRVFRKRPAVLTACACTRIKSRSWISRPWPKSWLRVPTDSSGRIWSKLSGRGERDDCLVRKTSQVDRLRSLDVRLVTATSPTRTVCGGRSPAPDGLSSGRVQPGAEVLSSSIGSISRACANVARACAERATPRGGDGSRRWRRRAAPAEPSARAPKPIRRPPSLTTGVASGRVSRSRAVRRSGPHHHRPTAHRAGRGRPDRTGDVSHDRAAGDASCPGTGLPPVSR